MDSIETSFYEQFTTGNFSKDVAQGRFVILKTGRTNRLGPTEAPKQCRHCRLDTTGGLNDFFVMVGAPAVAAFPLWKRKLQRMQGGRPYPLATCFALCDSCLEQAQRGAPESPYVAGPDLEAFIRECITSGEKLLSTGESPTPLPLWRHPFQTWLWSQCQARLHTTMYMPSWWLFNVALYVARFAAGCVGRQFVVIFVDSQEDYDRLKVKLQEKK